jgi:hypothetical protein
MASMQCSSCRLHLRPAGTLLENVITMIKTFQNWIP